MDLAALCDTYMELKIATIDVIWLFSVLMEDLPTTPTLHSCKSICGIDVAGQNYLKWWSIQIAIHSAVGP